MITISVLTIAILLSLWLPFVGDRNGRSIPSSLAKQHNTLSERNAIETSRLRVKKIYDSQLGVVEATGHNDGAQVERYLRYTGLGKGHAWCAAFVCWVLGQAGVDNPKTAWAASLFPKDRLVWSRGKALATGNLQRTTTRALTTGNSQLATIFGLYFPSLKRIAHCGFIDEWGEKEVITVEGNTNDSASREGDGVYRKRRPVKSLCAVADWIGRKI